MKTFNLVSVLGVMVLLTGSTFVQAQNFGSPNGGASGNMGVPGTFLGLPLPQQWTGTRPASMNQYGRQSSTFSSRNYGQSLPCTNGSCATGNCTTGSCVTGNCSTGNCPNGNCVNGQCTTRRPMISQPSNSNCANGQCRLNQDSSTRSNSYPRYDAQDDWSPRTPQSNIADPFQDKEYQNRNENWSRRPDVRKPFNDLMPSRYNSNDLDLRRPYFNNQSGELIRNRASDPASDSTHVRAPRPATRSSIGAPADREHGLAQI